METPIADDSTIEYPPKKKIKIDDKHDAEHLILPTPVAEAENEQTKKEHIVGINAFVSEHAGFHGTLKQRYHDFIVNEIMPDGKVVRLDDWSKIRPASKPTGAAVKGQMKPDSMEMERKVNDTSKEDQAPKADNNNGTPSADTQANGTPSADTQANGDPTTIDGGKKQEANAPIKLEAQDLEQLQKFFDAEGIEKLTALSDDISKVRHKDKTAYGFVDSSPIEEKEDRRAVHHIIRTVFLGCIETAHHDGDIIRCTAAAIAAPRKGKSKRKDQRGSNRQPPERNKLGNYMHFTLYKENRDVGEVLGFLSSKLKIQGQKIFDMAGNKDRRGVTSQRISAYRVQAERFLHLNNTITQACVGDCSYGPDKLSLGDLAGNEFLITLRDCVVQLPGTDSATKDSGEIKQYVRQSMQYLRDGGFINYFGLQRFGTFATRTDVVGQYMLNGDYKAAIDTILEFPPQALEDPQTDNAGGLVSSDDRKRAQALHWFTTETASTEDILSTLPRRFVAEYAIVSFLSRTKSQSNANWRGALEAIPRQMRSLYPHAYQSLIWNLAASHRWQLSPGKVMPGDLVFSSHTVSNLGEEQMYDAQGDPIYKVSIDHSESKNVHIVTEQDIADGTYTIFDVVLPQPGYEILYPSFMLPYYREIMHEHGNLAPDKMQRNWRDVNFPGVYRKLLGRPAKDWAADIVWYTEPDAKIAITDLEMLTWKEKQQKAQQDQVSQKQEQSSDPAPLAVHILPTSNIAVAADIVAGPRLAILLRFQLSSSTYATMALRELLKTGPIEYKPEFSGGRGL